MDDRTQRFTTTVVRDPRRRVLVPLPFDPDDAWGHKPAHPVAGTVNGMAVRAVIETLDERSAILLGPAWRRDCGIAPGDEVDVVLEPEGPQRSTRIRLPGSSSTGSPSSIAALTCAGSTAQRVDRTYVLLASTRSWHCCTLASSSDRAEIGSPCRPPGEHGVRGGRR